MTRCYNFCAGPAALPEAVLETARDDMLEWHDTGLSLMEMSHRSPEVVGVFEHAEKTLRELLAIGDDYAVPTEAGDSAIRWAAEHGGWLLDRTYSGKGCSGLLGLAAEGRFGADVVFVHTGGWPALFAPGGVPR